MRKYQLLSSVEQYCLYLRKSRADIEAEAHGEGETLARHEKLLLEVAKRGEYNVTQIYREIVSGETIAARPVMQQLLQEVEQGVWAGVLVVEVERLARGDTIDQGIMAQAFKYSGTKIITPLKVYDPENEFDEEYFEFGLFMSRREYKTINRRLQSGRLAASKEGKHVSGSKPYGYERVRCSDGKGWTLRPIEEEAEIVRYIFRLYTTGEGDENGEIQYIGTNTIARRLDALGVPTPTGGNMWSAKTICKILQNPVYIGKIRWGERKTKRVSENGSVAVKRVPAPAEEWTIADGLHPAIIDEEVFNKAAEIMHRGGSAPVPNDNKLTNPLAGIVRCAKCGRVLIKRKSPVYPLLRCANRYCDNVGAKLELVEERILQALSDWLDEYRLQWAENPVSSGADDIKAAEKALNRAENEVATLRKQLSRTHDLLEQGVYDTGTFLDRSRDLTLRINTAEKNVDSLAAGLSEIRQREVSKKNIVPKVEKLLEVYDALPSAQAKNDMLKEVLEKVVYLREVRSPKGGPLDNFELTLFPKLPPT